MTEAVSRLDEHSRYKAGPVVAFRSRLFSIIQECYEDGSISGKRDDIAKDVCCGLTDSKPMSELSTAALRVLVRMGEKVR